MRRDTTRRWLRPGGLGAVAVSLAAVVLAAGLLLARSPGGSSDPPDTAHVGVHADPRPGASAHERTQAARLLADTKEGTRRFSDLEAAFADGYYAITPTDESLVHYLHLGYASDDRVLDPERPESLVYFRAGEAMQLAGAMYIMPAVGVPGPRVGGPLTRWHVHTDLCFDDDYRVLGKVRPDGVCPSGVNHRTPEMLHVWVVEGAEDPFAEHWHDAGAH